MKLSYITLLKTAWRYARRERPRFALIYAMFACVNLLEAIEPLLYGWFIDRIQRDTGDLLNAALLYGGALFGLRLLVWCFHGPARYMELQLSLTLSANFLAERYRQALRLPVAWHQDHHSGDTINRIRKAYESLREFFSEGFIHISALSKLALCLIAMSFFSPMLGLAAAVLGALAIAVIVRFDGPLVRTRRQINEAEHAVSATLFDSLSNIMTVITLRLEHSMETGLLRKIAAYVEPFRKGALINEWKWFICSTIVTTIQVVLTIGYVHEHWRAGEVFYVGGLVTLLAYSNQFGTVFTNFAAQYNRIVRFDTDVETARSISDAFDAEHRADPPAELPASWNTINLRGLNFSHNGDPDAQTLRNFDLTLRRGRRIALVGESGSGKSTLLAILRGLYQPATGCTVEIDGRAGSFDTIREATTLLPQEPEVFENTLMYNITLGLPFEEAQIWRVCDIAQFSDTVQRLPRGLQSGIQEKGVNLSGGQKQRLALARGLLAASDCSIVLFDEPTSSVDARTEALIYKGVSEACKDKVLISALHRLHLLRDFDDIYVLKQGRLVGCGDLSTLLATCPEFVDIWRHQSHAAQDTFAV
jgi:ATP-binding cassette subfamily B protein